MAWNGAMAKVNGYQDTINKAQQEIKRLMGMMGDHNSAVSMEELKKSLRG